MGRESWREGDWYGRITAALEALGGRRMRVALLCAVALAGAGAVAVSGGELRYPDEEHYYRIARNVVELHLYSYDGQRPTADKPPGYAFLLVPVVVAGGDVLALKGLNVVALVLSAVLLFRFLERSYSSRAGALGVTLMLLYPLLFYAASTLYPQTVGATLLLAFLNLTLLEEPTHWRVLVAGVLYGLLILTIPSFLLLLPLVLPVLYLQWPRALRFKRVLVFSLVTCCVVGGWTARNWLTFGELVPLSTNSGVMLLKGNSENARAESGPGTDIRTYRRRAAGLDEVSRDRFFRREALAWVNANKMAAARLYLQKLVHYFDYSEELVVEDEGSRMAARVMMVTYYPLLLAACGLLVGPRSWRGGRREWLLAAIYLGGGLVGAIFFTRIRYRIPMDVILLILAAGFWDRVLGAVGAWVGGMGGGKEGGSRVAAG